jgi:hypothetical protein
LDWFLLYFRALQLSSPQECGSRLVHLTAPYQVEPGDERNVK